MANMPLPNLEFKEGYGNNYKALREKANLTQKELGKKLNISYSTISDIEKSKNPPTLEQLKLYHKHFKVSYEYLTGETNVMDTTVQAISDYTGLSEELVNKLHDVLSLYRGKYTIKHIDRLLRTINLREFGGNISKLISGSEKRCKILNGHTEEDFKKMNDEKASTLLYFYESLDKDCNLARYEVIQMINGFLDECDERKRNNDGSKLKSLVFSLHDYFDEILRNGEDDKEDA